MFVLGDRNESNSSLLMRPLFGREDEDGKRRIVGYLDQYAPEFDLIWDTLSEIK